MSLENMIAYPADADYWMRQALVEQLGLSTKYLIGERDAMYDACSDDEGNVIDQIDGEALAELDELIDANHAVMKAAGGGV